MSQISKANFLKKSRKNQKTILQSLANSGNLEKFSQLSNLINKETPLDIFLKYHYLKKKKSLVNEEGLTEKLRKSTILKIYLRKVRIFLGGLGLVW